jgi:hypothetical protein
LSDVQRARLTRSDLPHEVLDEGMKIGDAQQWAQIAPGPAPENG